MNRFLFLLLGLVACGDKDTSTPEPTDDPVDTGSSDDTGDTEDTQDTDTDTDTDDTDTGDTEVPEDTDQPFASAEGREGNTFCVGGGTVSNSEGLSGSFCLGAADIAAGRTYQNGQYTWQPGPVLKLAE